MKLLGSLQRRSFWSEVIYIGLNVALAVMVLLVVQATNSPLPAFALVALSKWRVFAVRPRYWLANIQANFVDFIVSIGVVVLLFSASTNTEFGWLLQGALTVLYIGWLVILKPRSSKGAVVSQAAAALFVGVTALFVVSYAWPVSLVVIAMGGIGYVTARHVMTQYKEDNQQFLSLLWVLVLAQLGWIAYHWTVAYHIPLLDVRVPQVSVIAMCLGLVFYKLYDSFKKHSEVRAGDVALPIIFTVSVCALLVTLFHGVGIDSL